MQVRTYTLLYLGFGWKLELVSLKVFGSHAKPSHWLIGLHKRQKYNQG